MKKVKVTKLKVSGRTALLSGGERKNRKKNNFSERKKEEPPGEHAVKFSDWLRYSRFLPVIVCPSDAPRLPFLCLQLFIWHSLSRHHPEKSPQAHRSQWLCSPWLSSYILHHFWLKLCFWLRSATRGFREKQNWNRLGSSYKRERQVVRDRSRGAAPISDVTTSLRLLIIYSGSNTLNFIL